MCGARGEEGAWASWIDSGKVLEAGVVAELLIEFELSLVKVKEEGDDEEVEEGIMVGVKIAAKVSLVGQREWVLVRGNYVSWKTIWGVT